MSKFAESNSRIVRILKRNEGNLCSGIAKEALGKVLQNPIARSLARNLVKEREPSKWLFLVGCYNSGTTIVRRVLESHPKIGTLPREGVSITDAFPYLESGGWSRMMYMNRHLWNLPDEGAKERVKVAKKDWAIWWPKTASIFFEKSIDHSTRISWLNQHFENAYFIGISRNPYCVNEGIARRSILTEDAALKFPKGYPPELLAKQWVAFDEALQAGQAAAKNFLRINYEGLTSNPVAEITKIIEFLELDIPDIAWDGSVLTFCSERHEIINQNENALARLCSDSRDLMTPIMSEAMVRNGYIPIFQEG